MNIMKKLLVLFSVCCFVFMASCAEKKVTPAHYKKCRAVKPVKKHRIKKTTKKNKIMRHENTTKK